MDLNEILKKYSRLGIIMGNELLLPPSIALALADDLGKNGIAIIGMDGWHHVDSEHPDWIVQDLSIDLYVGDEIFFSDSKVEDGVAKVKEWIASSLHENTAFVSFVLDVPQGQDLFPDTE